MVAMLWPAWRPDCRGDLGQHRQQGGVLADLDEVAYGEGAGVSGYLQGRTDLDPLVGTEGEIKMTDQMGGSDSGGPDDGSGGDDAGPSGPP